MNYVATAEEAEQIPNMVEVTYNYVGGVGHALIKSVELEIGGQRIDKQYGDWLHIWNELSQSAGK